MFPALSIISSVVELFESSKITPDVETVTDFELDCMERDYRVYTHLSHRLSMSAAQRACICEAVRASSTDNYPAESINNTLVPGAIVNMLPSYWSSKGQSDHQVPEFLTYRLTSRLCHIDEIKIQPFEAFFQNGSPIYSSKAVRFRMGYSRMPESEGTDPSDRVGKISEEFSWTYVSPEFPMLQENFLQSFKLPRPAVCVGGILQIMLLGRVQRQEDDGLFYICTCQVEIIGRPLSPAFDLDFSTHPGGLPVLKYFPNARGSLDDSDRAPSSWDDTPYFPKVGWLLSII